MDGVINDKGISTIFIGQRLRGFPNAPGREQRGKAHPVDVGGILKRFTVSFPRAGACISRYILRLRDTGQNK